MGSDSPSDQSSEWGRIDAVFQAALEQEEDQRQDWVTSNYSHQPEIHDAVLSLLADEKASAALFKGALNARDQLVDSLVTDPQNDSQAGNLLGSMIGPYRFEELIASGGMGAVYRAGRADGQFQQTVAIKILPGWATDPQTIARLRAERQILANLQHPNITRLLDGGQTEDGFPYLVLDFISGRNIAEYVRQAALTMRARLELFEKIARAIHYAHQNLVIHRDIKPANILVDETGNPQVLDFGIAKLMDIGAHDSPRTAAGFTPMTPEFASPEQREGKQVSTASDIYQLGLLLFHLLTDFRVTGEIAAATRPSSAVLAQKQKDPSPSGVKTSRLARQLKGDLDTIVQKALRENTQDRYSSAADMAADVRRHLDGEAIEARPESWWMASKRLSRNHPMAMTLGSALLAVIIVWASSMFFYARELEVQRDESARQAMRANQVKEVLVDIFRRTDPLETDTIGGKAVSVWDSLDAAAGEARANLVDEPDIQAELFSTFSGLYRNAGELNKARDLQRDAVSILQILGPTHAVQLAVSRADYASILKPADGWPLMQESLKEIPGFVDQNPSAAINILLDAANLKEFTGEFEQALGFYRQADNIYDQGGLVEPDLKIELLSGEAEALVGADRLEQANKLLLTALELGETHFGAEHRRLGNTLDALAELNKKRGNYPLSISYGERLVNLMEKDSATTYDGLLAAKNNLALSYGSAGQLEREQAIHVEIIGIYRTVNGPEGSVALGVSLKNLASSLHRSGDYTEALQVLAESRELLKKHLPANSVYQAFPHFTAALVYVDSGQPGPAEKESQATLDILEPILGEQHFQVQLTRCVLAEAYRAQGRIADASILAKPALKGMLASGTKTPRYITRCQETVTALGTL